MVLSVAAKAALKIAAKKRAIANAHRIKKTAKPRVKRRVKRKAVVEAKRTAKWQKHDKAVFDRVKTREGMIGLNRTKPKLKGIHGKGAAASDNMSDSDLKRNLVGTSKDGIYHTGLETSRIHTAPAARTRVYVPPPKGNLQDKELFRFPPKRKVDPFDKITKDFEGFNPAVFNAKMGVPYKKGFHGNWMSRANYDQLKPRKLAVQKSGDAVETAAGIAAACAWTPILGFHITGQYDKTKKPGRR